MDQSNNTLVKVNSNAKIVQIFCIEIKNKDQTLTFDMIRYTQFPSCSQYIKINEKELKSYMSAS